MLVKDHYNYDRNILADTINEMKNIIHTNRTVPKSNPKIISVKQFEKTKMVTRGRKSNKGRQYNSKRKRTKIQLMIY